MRAERSGRLERWVSGCVLLAVLLAACAAVLIAVAGPGTRLGAWSFGTGFVLLRAGARLGIAAAAAGLLAGLGAGYLRRPGELALAVLALAVGLAALGLPAYQLSKARSVPPIHDITTDWEQPPQFQALLAERARALAPAEHDGPQVAEQQRRAYPDIRPQFFRDPPAAVFAATERVARALDWDVAAAEPQEGRLEATDTTFWFGFKDDVVVRIRPEGEGSRVDVRSKSRVGRSDTGTNARRIREFLRRLHAAGLTPQGASPRAGS
ncbi:MAG: DUF1499 domain-containing protein [Candidatus Lambdaproteobacteria bacterium]|nr:DUF1499 domain-containing protein [Candidatus Lambdaproteobacteria bacterium]